MTGETRPRRPAAMASDTGQSERDPSETQDRRQRRSRKAMTEALMSLLRQHDWGAISVQMICREADVARSTFYSHYQTRQDLLDDLFSSGEGAFLRNVTERGLEGTLIWLASHLSESAALQQRLAASGAGHVIMTRFRSVIRERLTADLQAEGLAPGPEAMEFLTGGLFAMLDGWLARGCRVAPEPLAREAARLIRRTVAD